VAAVAVEGMGIRRRRASRALCPILFLAFVSRPLASTRIHPRAQTRIAPGSIIRLSIIIAVHHMHICTHLSRILHSTPIAQIRLAPAPSRPDLAQTRLDTHARKNGRSLDSPSFVERHYRKIHNSILYDMISYVCVHVCTSRYAGSFSWGVGMGIFRSLLPLRCVTIVAEVACTVLRDL
jgi:hypothetical protein